MPKLPFCDVIMSCPAFSTEREKVFVDEDDEEREWKAKRRKVNEIREVINSIEVQRMARLGNKC